MSGRFIAVLVNKQTGTHQMLLPFPSRTADDVGAAIQSLMPPPPFGYYSVLRAHDDDGDIAPAPPLTKRPSFKVV